MNENDAPKSDAPAVEAREVLTLPEAAELLRVSPRSVQRLMRTGTIPHVRVGRAVRFFLPQLRAWLAGGGARVADGPDVLEALQERKPIRG